MTVLLDSRSEQFFSLDDTGHQIWNMMATPCTRNEIIAALRDKFGVPEEQVAPDVEDFLGELQKTKLIEAVR